MTSNSRFSMAVHIMTTLAYTKTKQSSVDLAKTVRTNAVVVRRILGDLNQAGLILSERGKNGGFSLARAASGISLLDVYRAVTGDEELVPLHDNPQNQICPVSCKVRGVLLTHLDKAQNVYERELEKVALADLAKAM